MSRTLHEQLRSLLRAKFPVTFHPAVEKVVSATRVVAVRPLLFLSLQLNTRLPLQINGLTLSQVKSLTSMPSLLGTIRNMQLSRCGATLRELHSEWTRSVHRVGLQNPQLLAAKLAQSTPVALSRTDSKSLDQLLDISSSHGNVGVHHFSFPTSSLILALFSLSLASASLAHSHPDLGGRTKSGEFRSLLATLSNSNSNTPAQGSQNNSPLHISPLSSLMSGTSSSVPVTSTASWTNAVRVHSVPEKMDEVLDISTNLLQQVCAPSTLVSVCLSLSLSVSLSLYCMSLSLSLLLHFLRSLMFNASTDFASIGVGLQQGCSDRTVGGQSAARKVPRGRAFHPRSIHPRSDVVAGV